MTQREVYQLFSEWFNSVGFVGMTDREKDWIWLGFSVVYCHDNNKSMLSALQQILEIYDDHSGKVWTTSSKRRALDNARAAVNNALGETKMKLIDLLVKELPKHDGWPDGALSITQDNDGSLCVWDTNDPHYDGFSWKHHTGNNLMYLCSGEGGVSLASDHKESIVTYWQYKAALSASQKPAWKGEGAPPAGCECEFISNGTSWGKVKVIGFDGEKIVIRPSGEIYYAITPSDKDVFIPLRTEADKRRDAALDAIYGAIASAKREHNRSDEADEVYKAIAAGKIPGVKLDD